MHNILVQEEPRGPSVLIEVNVQNNGSQRIPIPDISQLRSTTTLKIVLKALRLIPSSVLTNGIISSNVTAPDAELQKMSLTIYAEGWEKGQTIPMMTFNDFQNTIIPNRFNPTRFSDWVNVDWPKSYIQYANGTVSAGAPYVVLLDCEYVRLNAENVIVTGAAQ
jgi:hypothetical protein